jgi:pseudouridine-5'-phosphate glycosidase
VNQHMLIAPEVRDALRDGLPVVALESTIISHGFPYPANVECARETERNVRECGAVPATIAILEGKLKVGLAADEIEHLASAGNIIKASRRDIPVLISTGQDGATTVAGTMLIASMAGIRVFATGGIGGVHRGAQESFDISADLLELARTDVAVVCAGAKSILDLGLTLEVLETHGVPVLGYRTDEFPAFYTRSSGHGVDRRFDSATEIARVIWTRRELGIIGGTVVANPIDAEHELDPEWLDGIISQALASADEMGVSGKELTPFLLGSIHGLTLGASEVANKQLVYSNARLAAAIASELVSLVD